MRTNGRTNRWPAVSIPLLLVALWAWVGNVHGAELWEDKIAAMEAPRERGSVEQGFGPRRGRDSGKEARSRRRGPDAQDHAWAGMMLWNRFSDEEREEMGAFIAEHFPDRYEEMLDLRDLDPDLFHRFVGKILPTMVRLRELSELDPPIFEIEKQQLNNEFKLRRLVRRFRHAKDAGARERIEGRIRPLVENLFDQRLKRMKFEIQKLEDRLAHLRETVLKQEADREASINCQINEMLRGEPDDRAKRRGRFNRGKHDRGLSGRGLSGPGLHMPKPSRDREGANHAPARFYILRARAAGH